MRIGFTGTREIEGREADIMAWLAGCTVNGVEYITGACIGFDAYAARLLLQWYPHANHRLIVPENRSQVDTDLFHEFITRSDIGYTNMEFMPKGSTYKDRNKRILDYADRVVGVAAYPETHGKSRRSGTWQTIRLARERFHEGEIDVLVLNP